MTLLKNTITKFELIFLASLLIFCISCSSDDDNNSAVGTTNVISSGWIEYDEDNWEPLRREFLVDFRDYPIEVPEITQSIVDHGVVLVYTRFVVTETETYILPFTENVNSAEGEIVHFRFSLNNLTIKMRRVGGVGDPGIFGDIGIVEYRYIIIPSNSTLKTRNDYSKMTYEEVVEYLNLDH